MREIIFLLDIADTGVRSRTVYDVQNARYFTYKKGGKKGQKVALMELKNVKNPWNARCVSKMIF